jgi:uncharacterized delta-60 repeat protein
MAAGFLDPSFGGDGRVVSGAGTGNAVVVQADGKVVTAGALQALTGTGFDFLLTRYNADGTPDTTFGRGGFVRTDLAGAGRSDVARAAALQSDGKIIVAGSSGRELAVARYNADGSLDTTFDGDGVATTAFGFSAAALDVLVQGDGKILASGSASATPGDAAFALARYNADGSPDTTFGTGGTVTTAFGLTAAYAVALAPGGRIVAGGTADTNFGDSALARYNADGSLDTTFGPSPQSDDDPPPAGIVRSAFGGFNEYDEIRDVAVDSDGSIVAAGTVEGRGMTVARFSANGLTSQRFESPELPSGPGGGASRGSSATALVLQPGDWVVAAGYTADAAGQPENFAVVRYNADGVVDRTFGFRGAAVTDFRAEWPAGAADPADGAADVVVAPGGALVVAGSSNGVAAVARYRGAGDAATAPVTVSADNSLALDGTAGNDDVRLYPWAEAIPRFAADLDGSLFLAPRGVGKAAVNAAGGDDTVNANYPGFNFPLDAGGGAGNDVLTGGGGADTLRGGDGMDVLDGAGGADLLQGGAGADTANYSSRTAALDVTLDGAANDGAAGEADNVMPDVETVVGGAGGDRLVGSAGNNALYGYGGNDTLDGGRGSDAVYGGAGDDTFLASETGAGGVAGSDYYWGGDGFDTVDYSGRTTKMDIRLGLFATSYGAGRDRDSIRDVEGAVGGSGDDHIVGTTGANRLLGGPGKDVLVGGRGNDTLLGGAGDDVLTDTDGTNSLDGGDGIDTVNGVSESTGPVVLQAEDSTVFGAGKAHDVAGFTGSGYVDYAASSGEYVEFTFDNGASPSQHTLTFRYANGGSGDRPLELKVNGGVVQSRLSFPPTGAWTTWKTVSITVQLAAGVNKIRLTSVGSSGGNLDSLTVS